MTSQWIQRPPFTLDVGGRSFEMSPRPLIMGILNVTPDSFSDGGRYFGFADAVAQAQRMAAEGADIIDVGGASTRPGSEAVDTVTELERVIPVIRELAGVQRLLVSVDTSKARVADAALEAGAALVNDVTALRGDPRMVETVTGASCAVCLMHMLGEPRTMQKDPKYDGDVVEVVKSWLAQRVAWAVERGVARARIIVDPGIGFGKQPGHNLEIVRRLAEFHGLHAPILVGFSRKSTVGVVLDEPVDGRLYGSLAAAAVSVMAGVHLLRVHDVKPTVDVVRMCEAIRQGICFQN